MRAPRPVPPYLWWVLHQGTGLCPVDGFVVSGPLSTTAKTHTWAVEHAQWNWIKQAHVFTYEKLHNCPINRKGKLEPSEIPFILMRRSSNGTSALTPWRAPACEGLGPANPKEAQSLEWFCFLFKTITRDSVVNVCLAHTRPWVLSSTLQEEKTESPTSLRTSYTCLWKDLTRVGRGRSGGKKGTELDCHEAKYNKNIFAHGPTRKTQKKRKEWGGRIFNNN